MMKFSGEARGMFGAAMRTKANGTIVGVKSVHFSTQAGLSWVSENV